jgi:GTP cyclohydrolase I
VREILAAIGENPNRDEVARPPQRVARAYRDLFGGVADGARHLARTFEHESDQLVVVGGIDFSSTCGTTLPFFGNAPAYLPANGSRWTLRLAHRRRIRATACPGRLTEQVAEALQRISRRGAYACYWRPSTCA